MCVECVWKDGERTVSRACCLTALSGNANDWRNREHLVLDFFSNLNMGNIQWLLSVNLWGQVITLRGLFLVSGTADDRRVLTQNAFRVYTQNVPVCTGTTPTF